MPFFRSKSYSNYLTRHSIYKSKKFFAPLQVRTHKYVALLKQKKFSGKRALSWVSFGGRRNITEEKRGSLTLEAALCFPLAKADPGSSRVCVRRDQPVCLCFLSL